MTMNNKTQKNSQDPLIRALEKMRATMADTSYKKTWAERMKESLKTGRQLPDTMGTVNVPLCLSGAAGLAQPTEELDAKTASLREARKKLRS